jgi:hypothetical protein
MEWFVRANFFDTGPCIRSIRDERIHGLLDMLLERTVDLVHVSPTSGPQLSERLSIRSKLAICSNCKILPLGW